MVKKPPKSATYKSLRNLVRLWVRRGKTGAAELLKEVDSLKFNDEKRACLQANMNLGSAGRKAVLNNIAFKPSVGDTVQKLEKVDLQISCVRKSLITTSRACRNTKRVYAQLLLEGRSDLPIAQLIKTDCVGKCTRFWCEYLGRDAAKAKVPEEEFKQFRSRACKQLSCLLKAPFPMLSRNWVVIRGDGVSRAVLIDVGNLHLRD